MSDYGWSQQDRNIMVGMTVTVVGGSLLLNSDVEVLEVISEKGTPRNFWKLKVKDKQGRIEVVLMSNTKLVQLPKPDGDYTPARITQDQTTRTNNRAFKATLLPCDICGKERPETLLKTITRDISERMRLPLGSASEQVTYCIDSIDCMSAASDVKTYAEQTPAEKSRTLIAAINKEARETGVIPKSDRIYLSGQASRSDKQPAVSGAQMRAALGLTSWPICSKCNTDIETIQRRPYSENAGMVEYLIRCHGELEVRRYPGDVVSRAFGLTIGYAFQDQDKLIRDAIKQPLACKKCNVDITSIQIEDTTVFADGILALLVASHHNEEVYLDLEIAKGLPLASFISQIQQALDDAFEIQISPGDLIKIGERFTRVASVFNNKIIDDMGAAINPKELIKDRFAKQTTWIPRKPQSGVSNARLLLDPDPGQTSGAKTDRIESLRADTIGGNKENEARKPKKPIRKIIFRDGE